MINLFYSSLERKTIVLWFYLDGNRSIIQHIDNSVPTEYATHLKSLKSMGFLYLITIYLFTLSIYPAVLKLNAEIEQVYAIYRCKRLIC